MTSKQSLQSTVRHLLTELRRGLHERRQASAAHLHLKRELAAYRTPWEIRDLLATVDRQGDAPGAEQVRVILADNLSQYRRGQRLADVM